MAFNAKESVKDVSETIESIKKFLNGNSDQEIGLALVRLNNLLKRDKYPEEVIFLGGKLTSDIHNSVLPIMIQSISKDLRFSKQIEPILDADKDFIKSILNSVEELKKNSTNKQISKFLSDCSPQLRDMFKGNARIKKYVYALDQLAKPIEKLSRLKDIDSGIKKNSKKLSIYIEELSRIVNMIFPETRSVVGLFKEIVSLGKNNKPFESKLKEFKTNLDKTNDLVDKAWQYTRFLVAEYEKLEKQSNQTKTATTISTALKDIALLEQKIKIIIQKLGLAA